jgi:hypothetical protein
MKKVRNVLGTIVSYIGIGTVVIGKYIIYLSYGIKGE